jgi:hypothetical protein
VNSRQDQQLAFRLSSWAAKRKKSVDLLPDCRNIKKRHELPRHGEIKDFFLEEINLGKGKYG